MLSDLVQSRTGPGMNQLGGIAEIINVHTSSQYEHTDRGAVSYDVRYVLNRRQREYRLEACYISEAPEYNKFTSMTIGSSDVAAKKRCTQRRSCPNPISVLPSPLRAALLADGCDVDGIATRKALAQYNNKSSTIFDKENSGLNSNVQRVNAKAQEVYQNSKSKRKALGTKTANSLQTKSRQPPTKRIKPLHPKGVANDDNVDDGETCCAWTNAVKCQLADELYRNKIETALQKGVIYISTSLLSIVEQDQLQQLCRVVHKNIKGKMCLFIFLFLFVPLQEF